jgi:TM2 domain-containing membrane protein YozV
MKLFIIFFIVISIKILPQNPIDFYSPANIKKFADFLFCDKDFLRAAIEYERYSELMQDDSIKFKLGLSYSMAGSYKKAEQIFSSLNSESSRNEYFKSLFQQEEFSKLRKSLSQNLIKDLQPALKKLYFFSFFFTSEPLPEFETFSSSFNTTEKELITNFYNQKKDPPLKNPLTAALLSAIIPGTGKIYTGQVGDGIVSLISVGLLAYLSYANFQADHKVRGWIFASVGSLFYAGNIYGSAASADIYNAGIQFNFKKELNIYLNRSNYFITEYIFCN